MQIDSKKPMRISVLGVPEKMRNTLQYFFHGPCSDQYEMVDDDLSELSIIDLDGFSGQQSLENHRNKSPEKPLILLSINNEDIEDGILVRKPLQPDNLISALEIAQQRVLSDIDNSNRASEENQPQNEGAEKPVEKSELKTPNPASNPVDKITADTDSALSTLTKPRVSPKTVAEDQTANGAKTRADTHHAAIYLDMHDEQSYIGSAPDIAVTELDQLAKVQYDPEIYFQDYLNQAVTKADTVNWPVLLTIPDGWLVIRPHNTSILIDIKESKLHAFSALPVTDQTITISLLDKSGVFEYRGHGESIELEQLLWKSAIWSSRGRLPTGTSLTSPVLFQYWPNLSRLLRPPHALRIAALWSEQPCSLLHTASTLQIPQRYVFAFYSACHAIGVASVKPISVEAIAPPAPQQMNRKRAILGRILERIKGLHQTSRVHGT